MTKKPKILQCARCKREFFASAATYYNEKPFCERCRDLFGTCGSCVNNSYCAFQEDPSPIPHVIMAQIREGNMVMMEQKPNPKRIKALCIEGGCKCVVKLNDKYACGRIFMTCPNYKEREW